MDGRPVCSLFACWAFTLISLLRGSGGCAAVSGVGVLGRCVLSGGISSGLEWTFLGYWVIAKSLAIDLPLVRVPLFEEQGDNLIPKGNITH